MSPSNTAPAGTSATASPALPRRRFLAGLWSLALALLAGQGLGALWLFLRPAARADSFGGRVRAGRVEEFALGSISHVGAGQFYVSRLPEGLLAMWHRCTHLGCTVPWVAAEARFNCPCHGSIFNTKGEVLAGPAPRPLDLLRVEIVEGEVWVDTTRAITRVGFDPSQVTTV
ncbi:MAG TPA: Rieske 2Fe-2S domain-containing protein [Anaerolineales bacterium]|nr:Rieske 2Fe-2S domain-containing protein [Anaerolineales bacterium]